MADWKKIKTEYIKGGVSLKELAEKYEVSFSTLRKKSASEKWIKTRNKISARAEQKAQEKISDQLCDELTAFYRANELGLERMMLLLETVTDEQAMASYYRALREALNIKKDELHLDNESKRLELDREKFEFEKSRAVTEDNSTDAGIVMMPSIMEIPEEERRLHEDG